MDSGHANMSSMNSNNIGFYQFPSQAFPPSITGLPNDYNNDSTDGNEPLNTAYYGYVGNCENGVNHSTINYNLNDCNPPSVSYSIPQTLTTSVQTPSPSSVFQINYGSNNYNEPSIRCPLPQTLSQTPYTSTFSNNASMVTNATSHGQVIIIINADIDLDKLLSIIQLCGRVERINM